MDRVRGHVIEVLAFNRVRFEISYTGNYNKGRYPDCVVVRFTDLTPPFLKNVSEADAMLVLNKNILGVDASLQVQSKDLDGALVGRLKLEGVRFRRKRKTL